MADPAFEPLPVSYTGLFADAHMVDAYQFGRSVSGVSRVGNQIYHLLLFGELDAPSKQQVKLFVLPSKKKGLLQEF